MRNNNTSKKSLHKYDYKFLTLTGGIIILIFVTRFSSAQDAQFSQFYSNSLYLAPSFAGLTGETRIGANYRIQWPEMPGAYHTYSFSADHAINAFNSGLGLIILNDKAGSGNLSSLTINLQYSYNLKINNYWHFVPGLYFSYLERYINFQKLTWHDQISPTGTAVSSAETLPINRVHDLDFGSSLLAYSDQFWVGISFDHFLTPNQSFYVIENNGKNFGYIPFKYTFFGGTKFINKGRLYRPYDTSLQLAFLFKKQESFKQLDLGLYWYNKPFVLGFWYRGIPVLKPFPNQDAFIFLVGYKLDYFNIGYSYDFTISKLVARTGGSHEISLSYSFKTKLPKRKPRIVPCPDF
jgi:type IX secretion system PorP/SprF family membrane protein